MDYVKRISDQTLAKYLETFGAVLIEGPKWCGKTRTGREFARSVFDVADPANNFQNRLLAQNDQTSVLAGETPRLIDEWQEVPALWDAVKHTVDAEGRPGLYLLAGSSTPRDENVIHSGAGRIGRLRMSTMTLQELGLSDGTASLAQLLYSDELDIPVLPGEFTLDALIEQICRGGWPGLIGANLDQALLAITEYIRTLTEEDTQRVDNIQRNPAKIAALLQSLARNTASLVSQETIRRDVSGGQAESISPNTLDEYLNVLRRLFILDEIPAWYPALKSTVRLRTSPKRILSDPSLAVAALNASPTALKADLKLVGNLFETLVLHDLQVYARACGAKVYHYNDNTDLEIDAIVEGRDMKWGAVEVKLSYVDEDKAATSLKRLEGKLALEKQRQPEFLAVVTGIGSVMRQREDGVWVIPVDRLGV